MRFIGVTTLAILLSACGIDPEPRLYGTWYEPVTGEVVRLNENGSLEWFGETGTFDFSRNTNALCNIARDGCADGEVVFRLPSSTFRLAYSDRQFTSTPGLWSSPMRNYGGLLDKYEHDGISFDFVQLVREDYAPLPYSLEGFESMNRGLDSEGLYPSLGGIQVSREELVRSGTELSRWNHASKRWEAIPIPTISTYGLIIGESYLYSNDGFSSSDLGESWQSVPGTRAVPLPNNEWLRETFVVGNRVLVTRQHTNEGRTELTRETDIFELNLDQPEAGWQLLGTMPVPARADRVNQFAVHAPTGTFMAQEFDTEVRISRDEGATWTAVDGSAEKCRGTWPSVYLGGFYCTVESGSDLVLSAYNLEDARWFTYEPAENGFTIQRFSATPQSSGFTFVHDATVWLVEDTGTVTPLVTLPSMHTAYAHIVGAYTIVQQFGLWFQQND